jgi:hypothetical protein
MTIYCITVFLLLLLFIVATTQVRSNDKDAQLCPYGGALGESDLFEWMNIDNSVKLTNLIWSCLVRKTLGVYYDTFMKLGAVSLLQLPRSITDNFLHNKTLNLFCLFRKIWLVEKYTFWAMHSSCLHNSSKL